MTLHKEGPQSLGCERWERIRERGPVSVCSDVAALT